MNAERPSATVRRRLRALQLGASPTVADAANLLNAELGIDPAAHGMAQWLARKFNHNFDDFDRAIDAVYNDTHVGGSMYHHLLDGQHTIWGAFKAVRGLGDDGWLREMGEAMEHLTRDAMSISGINPLFSMQPDHFERLGDIVATVGISKPFLVDALTVNGPELLGGAAAILSAVMMGRQPSPDRLSRLGGGCLLSATVSANPMLMPIAAAGLVYAFVRAEDKRVVIVQAGKGALVSGTAILVGTLVGGPVWVGCVAGLVAAVAVSKAIDDPERTFERARALVAPATEVLLAAAAGVRGLRLEDCYS